MPNPGSDRPLRKVTLNLYEEDCQWLEKGYGDQGWTTRLREILHSQIELARSSFRKRTVGDLDVE